MTFKMTEQTHVFCLWLNNKLKLHNKQGSVIDYLDKKYPNDDISILDTEEYKEFLIECKRNAINKDLTNA